MRYEIRPFNGRLVTVCNDIPNNSYLYSNVLSSNQMAIIKKEQGHYIELDMSDRVTTANTKFNVFLQRNPNDEIFIVDQTSKTNSCNAQAYKLDINNCTVSFKMDATYNMRIVNPLRFMKNYVDYNTAGFLNTISRKITRLFQSTLNESVVDGYELISNGIQLNEMIQRIKFEIDHSCQFEGIDITFNDIHIEIDNFHEISEFYNRDLNFARQTKEHIVTRLVDTIFDQYSNTETISANQTRILETYLNNAIIENNDFNIEEITEKFSKMSRTFSFQDLIDNLDQVNKRLSNTYYLEDK